MTHYLQSADGSAKFKIEMGCNHPDMKDNSTASIGCSGNCTECTYSVASMTIPECLELMKRADCNHLQ